MSRECPKCGTPTMLHAILSDCPPQAVKEHRDRFIADIAAMELTGSVYRATPEEARMECLRRLDEIIERARALEGKS